MVISDMEYTKHFYAESQRVTTKLGGGFQNALVSPQTATLDAIEGNIQDISDNLWNYIYENTNCVAGEPDYVSINPSLPIIDELLSSNNDETDLYFYHPDHLGSSSFITDVNGDVNQHLQYLPFGESFIDQQTNHNIRFTFSSKEKDSETGFGYFGARYYSSDLSVWLSVDPLADKYPSMSSFMYCAGNPVKFIDPDGRRIRPINKEAKEAFESHLSTFGNDMQLVKIFNIRIDERKGTYSADIGDISKKAFKKRARKAGLDKKLINSAYSTYLALVDNDVIEIETVSAGEPSTTYSSGTEGTKYEGEATDLNTNPELIKLQEEADEAGSVTPQILKKLLGSKEYKFFGPDNTNEQNKGIKGTIIINSTDKNVKQTGQVIGKALEDL